MAEFEELEIVARVVYAEDDIVELREGADLWAKSRDLYPGRLQLIFQVGKVIVRRLVEDTEGTFNGADPSTIYTSEAWEKINPDVRVNRHKRSRQVRDEIRMDFVPVDIVLLKGLSDEDVIC